MRSGQHCSRELALQLADVTPHRRQASLRPFAGPAAALATASVLITAAVVAATATVALSTSWATAIPIGAAVAPTDAAATIEAAGQRRCAGTGFLRWATLGCSGLRSPPWPSRERAWMPLPGTVRRVAAAAGSSDAGGFAG